MHFLETLRKQTEHTFGWVVFNELVINVSPQGRFDFVEHAHLLSGPKRTSVQPLVTLVFVPYAAMREGIGEFGVGVKMAPIDDEVAASQNPSEDP